jgi:hypothetical protein
VPPILDRPPSRSSEHAASASDSSSIATVCSDQRLPKQATQAIKRHQSSRSIASDPIKYTSRGVQIPIAPAAPPHLPPSRFPCMGRFLSRNSQSGKSFVFRQLLCSISKPVFFVPTRGSLTSSRAGAVKVGRRANLAACSELARPYLDSFEHDGTLSAIGMTIRGEPASGRGSVAPQPCIRWVQGPEP